MQKRPRMTFPRPLSGVMQESLISLGLAERLQEAKIWRIWPSVVGETIANRAQPIRIINGVLTIAVSSAPWLQELRFLTGMMKEKLNGHLGSDLVKEIVLKSGRVLMPQAETPDGEVPVRVLTELELAVIDEQSALIEDPETRSAFAELMKTSLERQFPS